MKTLKKEVEKILKSMSLEEKASLLSQYVMEQTDVGKYGLSGFLLADGPSGIRKMKSADSEDIYDTVPLTSYPSASTYACSWDRELLRELGHCLGAEAQAEGVSVLLGPGCNIKRSPLGGRNFEYYSEDPVLTSELATEYVLGLQEEGTGACVKHFACNNQETRRMTVNEHIDNRTLHEIYLKAFEKPVRTGKPYMVMSAYNRVNGEYGAESGKLLRDTLRGEWGYQGNVVTDCFGAHNLAKAVKNGLNLQMAGESAERLAEEVGELISRGSLTEEELDASVAPTVELSLKCRDSRRNTQYDPEQHHRFAEKLARESMVLLKNEENFLPVSPDDRIAVIGGMAGKLRFQGGGSSHVTPYCLEQVNDAVRRICPGAVYSQGYDDDVTDEALMEEAVKTAQDADKVIFCMGLPEIYESEGYDRMHMRLPKCQEELLMKILEVNPQVAVVLFHGAPVEMPWIHQVRAVLDACLPGEAGGSAVADLLFGRANPCGKLAETIPVKLSDNPSYLNFPGSLDNVVYAERIYVGYRYYDKKEMEVRFPFGYGLSYTTFSYSGLEIGCEGKTVSLDVENTGNRDGGEIVQIYVRKPGILYDCPIRELAGFEKVFLRAGEKRRITIALEKYAYSIYDGDADCWSVEGGTYVIEAGRSSRDICLEQEIVIGQDRTLAPITEDTCLGDMLEIYGKKETLEELFAGYPDCRRFLHYCMDANPLIRTMGTLMSFQTLRRVDNTLKEDDIRYFLKVLNQ
ncbi:hypothetical protein B5F07_08115 [Lachnoclostridium sp. An169]|uniref:beta-glucosidase n=1 Tax=Lachnoclostridium sp. An169 TaxID=1965569 RepID=UPI000B384792|nr:glycoside hydrolase family 3 C-terminal domain-containing protein [Lachnoclostridium sp. An169]OUP84417.1 hypothetical protein B5F07_08115 [Lachnoclostridium sp. An169]